MEMKKKMMSSLLISIFLIMTLIPSVQSTDTTRLNTTELHTQLPTSESHLLETTTIGTVTALIKDYLHQMPYSSRFKERFTKYLEQGLFEMEKLGITSEKNLLETQIIVTNEPLLKNPFKSHRFLMNINPDSVNIETTIPTYIENQTGDNYTIEIFIKLIPLVDSIQTIQRIIIRKFYQESSLLWPAIGLRIIEDGETVFIIAFGKGITWNFKFW